MAAADSVSFDILARDKASGAFKEVGRSVSDMAAKMDIGARQARVLAESLEAQRRAADASIGATLALARADKIFADAEKDAAGAAKDAGKAVREADQARKDAAGGFAGFGKAAGNWFSSVKTPAASLTKAFSGIGQGFAQTIATMAGSGPIGLAIVAGLAVNTAVWATALAPIAASLIPIGIGFATLARIATSEWSKITAAVASGGKAWAALSPAEKAVGEQLKGVQKAFAAVAKAIRPEVLTAFGTGLRIVKGLMPALEPLAKAAGKAVDSFLKSMEGWLKSPGGQAFVHWLETSGPKDIQGFGRGFWDVAKTIGDAFNQIYRTGRWLGDRLRIDVVDHIARLFEVDIPAALSILVNEVKLDWDEIVIATLTMVRNVLGAMSHIPLISHAFGAAADAVGRELTRMQADAKAAADSINASLARIHGRHVVLDISGEVAVPGRHKTTLRAAGWRVPGYGGGDRWPALLEGGETVVPKHLTPAVAPLMKAHGVPGFAAGGIAGLGFGETWNPSVKSVGASIAAAGAAMEKAIEAAALKVLQRAGTGIGGGYPGPGGGSASANAALARRLVPKWAVEPYWGAWNYVAMAESGWSNIAYNPSGAYGIPQALPFTKMPRAAWPPWAGGSANPTAQITWMAGYMQSVYGGPLGAAAHEAAFHNYDRGGWLPTGVSVAVNRTGRPERVGGGDMHVHINVNATPLAHPADIGRAVAEVLAEFKKRGGWIYKPKGF